MANPHPGNDGPPLPAGESGGEHARFSASQLAAALGVDRTRVVAAMAGEFGLGPEARVDSRQAQRLCEALLDSSPLDLREAALMILGAFTPRPDVDGGIGDAPPGEASDRYAARPD
ncbi:MAG: hypothetical protein ACKOWF_08160, partial [Chloroflexota bacterium]